MRPGICSACNQPACQAPSGHWWHQGQACEMRSALMFRPVTFSRDPDGTVVMGPSNERPAKFVEAA